MSFIKDDLFTLDNLLHMLVGFAVSAFIMFCLPLAWWIESLGCSLLCGLGGTVREINQHEGHTHSFTLHSGIEAFAFVVGAIVASVMFLFTPDVYALFMYDK